MKSSGLKINIQIIYSFDCTFGLKLLYHIFAFFILSNFYRYLFIQDIVFFNFYFIIVPDFLMKSLCNGFYNFLFN